jgi:phospholipase/carboxylesterase
MIELKTVEGPHRGQPVLTAGQPLSSAKAAMVMIHGRGASAQDILSLVPELAHPDFAYLAPQAAGYTWYPYGFMSPLEQNEPHLSSALATVGALVDYLTQTGFSAEAIMLLGFSQGACLSLEFAARNTQRYGGLAGLSGGLIGPDDTPRDYQGSLTGTPVFLGCSDVDFHIPKERVMHTAEVLEALGADVTMRLYPNMGHTINQDEIDFVRKLMAQIGD